jgi:uncharacterized protein YndB with AHSA1/START domain
MLPTAQNACFLIADISGYTSYLAGVELEHAQDIIADLMEGVVRCLRPPFRLAKFEGDAAFLCAPCDKIDGSQLQDAIESAYFAFRKRLRNIDQATSCTCKACHGMKQLDLKFVVHHGEFIKQRMAGRDELAGRDVILVHRLLKNAVTERLGGRAYVLFSDPCIRAMDIDPVSQGLLAHEETIDIIGPMTCWLRDLETAWTEEKDRRRHLVTRKQAAPVIEFDIAALRPQVWEYFTVPGQRPKWRGADEVRETVSGGRRGAGTTNHCMHGPHAIIEEILDWRPFDYLTLTTLLPVPNAPKVPMSYVFSETGDGSTHIEIRLAKAKPRDTAFLEHVVDEFRKNITQEIATLRGLLERERGPSDAAMEEFEPTAPRRSSPDAGIRLGDGAAVSPREA